MVARWWPGWRITTRDEIQNDKDSRQLGLGQLMTMVAIVSVSLGASQWILPPANGWPRSIPWSEAFYVVIGMPLDLLFLLPGIWLLFRSESWQTDIMIVGVCGPFYAFVVTVLENAVFLLILGSPSLQRAIFLLAFNLTQILSIGLSVGILRLWGLRFVCMKKRMPG